MTRMRFDQLAKRLLTAALADAGRVEVERETSAEPLTVDLLFEPGPQPTQGASKLRQRAVLGAIAQQTALIEAFHSLDYDVYMGRGVQQDAELITPGEGGAHIILLGPKSERIVRPCQVPGVLSETVFLSCPSEAKLIQNATVLDRLARAYADAVDAYFQGTVGLADNANP